MWTSVPARPARTVPSAWTDPTPTPACVLKVWLGGWHAGLPLRPPWLGCPPHPPGGQELPRPSRQCPDPSCVHPSRHTGYTGTHCEVDIDECVPDPCHYGTCKDGVATFTCLCQPGYTGHHCETNINECYSQPCRHGGTCQDRDNAYFCFCLKGTTGTGQGRGLAGRGGALLAGVGPRWQGRDLAGRGGALLAGRGLGRGPGGPLGLGS